MKKTALLIMLTLLGLGGLWAQQNVSGFWKTIDDETGKAKSVLAIYTYQNKLYGRVILAFEDDGVTIEDDIYRQTERSPYLVGDAPFCGLDVIWDLEWNARKNKWLGGSIMDPGDEEKEPKIYNSELWREGNDLIVRGKIAFIGRNQTWKQFNRSEFPAGFRVPDTSSFVPVIPEIK